MTNNGERAKLGWKLVGVLMSVLILVGGYLHGVAINDLATQELAIKGLEVRSALLEQATGVIQEKQDEIDATLTEVRDGVIRIEAKLDD